MTFNYSNVYLNETSTISGHLEKDGNYKKLNLAGTESNGGV